MIKDSHFKKLDETDRFIAGNIFEDAYLIDKRTHKEIYLDSFYGDPCCGLISLANDWCIIAGHIVCIWKDGKVISLNDDLNLKWIIEIRQSAHKIVDLLIDPYSENGAVWQLNIETLQSKKLRDYKKGDKEYTEKFDW